MLVDPIMTTINDTTWLTPEYLTRIVLWDEESTARTQLEAQQKVFWTVDALRKELPDAIKQWPTIPAPVRHVLRAIFAFFSASDAFANQVATEHLAAAFDASPMVIKSLISFHGMMEGIHAEAYGLLVKLSYGGSVDKDALCRDVAASPAVVAMLSWGHHYATAECSLIERLLGLIVFEGVLFTPLFAVIYAVKARSVLKIVCTTNEYIARDELMHVNNGIILLGEAIRLGHERPTEAAIHAAFTRGYACAKALMDEFLPTDIPDWFFVRETFLKYTKQLANTILEDGLGAAPLFKVDFVMPEFLKAKEVPQFTSFHAVRPTQYVRAIAASADELDELVDDAHLLSLGDPDDYDREESVDEAHRGALTKDALMMLV
jgi:ribonucleotide reductase beta subunit family protein with ferritin-like domain